MIDPGQRVIVYVDEGPRPHGWRAGLLERYITQGQRKGWAVVRLTASGRHVQVRPEKVRPL